MEGLLNAGLGHLEHGDCVLGGNEPRVARDAQVCEAETCTPERGGDR